ncbi:Ubiquitin carboxyl-terminal hydrolase family protein [Aphelenchoides avenae]|nr:Ubiquitin carboxyl-terminal hydrolase family protein [Aphelenchus avenae]
MDAVWSGEYVAIRPSRFLDVFADKVNPDLADRRQHDAQEFLIFLLDALNEDTCRGNHKGFEQHYTGKDLKADAQDYEEKGRSFFSSSIKDLFYVRTVSELRCTVCRTLSVTFEEMSQISVELPSHSSYATLDDCLARHFAPVTLDGASRWNCPTCKCAQAATRETRIWKLPPVLVVHMKRFSHGVTGFVKNEMEVDFRVDGMKMANFVHLMSPEGGADYHLYAVTNHDGTLNSGHYTSFVRNMHTPQEWIKFDDEAVSAAAASQLVSKKAFILYYKRH